MSSVPNQELEERLSAVGKSLLQPPSSVDELLKLLDQTEALLSKVDQSPAKSMKNALSPLMKALVSEELLKHSDVDVQVGLASCISEITRITAPDAPYDDDKMKVVFQLIVSSFDNLSDTSSKSHQKRANILETVAKVRSCLIMLDLEWDQMIIEMFQHFLKSIRVYHAEVIFASMETIMTLVLEESEDISPDLLKPILDTLRKNNEEVLPIAKKLAKRVIQNCADKLRPYIRQAVNTLNASLDDYNEVVASACQKNSGSLGHSDENILKDQTAEVLSKREDDAGLKTFTSSAPAAEDVKEEIKPQDNDLAEDVKEEIRTQETAPPSDGSPKSIACNIINKTGDGETITDENILKEVKSKQQSDAKSPSRSETDDTSAEKPANLEVQVEHVANGEARQFNSRNNSAESSDFLNDEKQTEQVLCHQEVPREEILSLPGELPPVEPDKHLDTVKDTIIQLSPSKEAETEAVKVASPILSGSLPDENQPKRSARTKRKENMVKEEAASADTSSKKDPKGANIAEVNKKRRTMKKQQDEIINVDKALTEGVSKNDAGTMSDSEARCAVPKEKLGDDNKTQDGSLSKENGRKSGRGKPKFEKDSSKYSTTKDNGKDKVASLQSPLKSTRDEVSKEETPRVSAKRKRTPGTENTSRTIQYGENLVGSKVKVWWPKDHMFYEGVIASFDPVKKKHKVMYDDGDEEILNLRKERWEFVGDDSVLDGGQSGERSSHDASSNKKKKGHANSETSSKQEKTESLPRRKVKGNATKSGSKSKDDGKAEPESNEDSQDETEKTEDNSQELEDKSPHGSAAKASKKSQSVDVARTSSPKKQDIQRSTNSKGKTPQSGKTLSPSGKGMKKSSSLKVKENVRMEKTMDSVKSPDTDKGAKSQETGTKSGKKRRK